jgi:hypothetical protein
VRRLTSALTVGIGVVWVSAACHYEGYNPAIPKLPVYAIHQLGVASGGSESAAEGGSMAAIVGWSDIGDGLHHAVTFAGGTATRLTEPAGASNSTAYAVNSSGVIVGVATTGGVTRPVVWASATATPVLLPTLGGTYGVARSINDQNVIAGVAQTDTGDTVIVVWQQGGSSYTVAPVDTGGGVDWTAVDVNNQMDIAGNLGPVATSAGAFYLNSAAGVNDTITPPGAGVAVAHGMNNYGIVVGSINAEPGTPPQAWVFTDNAGTVVLGAPPGGYTGIRGNAITDGGIIGGTATNTDNSGIVQSSVAAISSVTNVGGTFQPLPSLGGTVAEVADNGETPCGALVGRAAASGTTPQVAVAWTPTGCAIP